MIPYSRPKRSDLYNLFYSKLLENHTLHSSTDLYSPYMAVTPQAWQLPLTGCHCYVLGSHAAPLISTCIFPTPILLATDLTMIYNMYKY